LTDGMGLILYWRNIGMLLAEHWHKIKTILELYWNTIELLIVAKRAFTLRGNMYWTGLIWRL